jgi:hypothetical protein
MACIVRWLNTEELPIPTPHDAILREISDEIDSDRRHKLSYVRHFVERGAGKVLFTVVYRSLLSFRGVSLLRKLIFAIWWIDCAPACAAERTLLNYTKSASSTTNTQR